MGKKLKKQKSCGQVQIDHDSVKKSRAHRTFGFAILSKDVLSTKENYTSMSPALIWKNNISCQTSLLTKELLVAWR